MRLRRQLKTRQVAENDDAKAYVLLSREATYKVLLFYNPFLTLQHWLYFNSICLCPCNPMRLYVLNGIRKSLIAKTGFNPKEMTLIMNQTSSQGIAAVQSLQERPPLVAAFLLATSRASACGGYDAAGLRPRPGARCGWPDRPRSCPRTNTSCPDSRRCPPTPECAWRRGPGTCGRG